MLDITLHRTDRLLDFANASQQEPGGEGMSECRSPIEVK